MDTASTLMGLGLLILFIAPVGYLVYTQSFQEKKRAKKMAFLALQQGYNLHETENINGLSLGLDILAKKFFLLKSGRESELQVMDLEKVSKIELLKTDEDGYVTQNVDEIREISLQMKSSDGKNKTLVFYAEEEDPVTQKSDRLDNAVKWQKILQKYSQS
ncbi:hypothetical protein [Salinimicrobium oceani]|uniref:Uncharacterized protein n=1 Tax=Salinimicrobium oceani TaxID=2722702 RepID=A0ABX1CUT5_9FLAO|nr:hypothetical protein [Salinimicrobium oceani]NJW52056.1 hypothetical protein [Salinimicrobium oceani]